MATYQELLQQQKDLEKQIEAARKQELSEAITKVRSLMSQYGLTMADITSSGKTSSAKGTKVPPKYRNAETGDTWTGRGRQPKWVEAALASGKKLEDLSV